MAPDDAHPLREMTHRLDPYQHLANAGIWTGTAEELFPGTWPAVFEYAHDWAASPAVAAEAKAFNAGSRTNYGLKAWVIRENFNRNYPIDHPLIPLTRSTVLLDLISQAIGPARLVCLDLTHNPAGASEHAPQWSQQWHRDPEDPYCVKTFLYVSDVAAEHGPFEYTLGSHAAWRNLCPECRYPDPPIPDDAIPTQLRFPLIGPAGTAAVAMTAGLHRGGHGSAPRTMITLTHVPYNSPCKPRITIQ